MARWLARRNNDLGLSNWGGPFDRMMDDMVNIFNTWPSDMLRSYEDTDLVIRPRGDFYRENGKVVAEFEIPGIDPKKVDLKVYKDQLELKAEKGRENKVEKENYLRSERYYGSVSRNIQLPFEIDPSSVKATYKSGILKVEMEEITESDTSMKVNIDVED